MVSVWCISTVKCNFVLVKRKGIKREALKMPQKRKKVENNIGQVMSRCAVGEYLDHTGMTSHACVL